MQLELDLICGPPALCCTNDLRWVVMALLYGSTWVFISVRCEFNLRSALGRILWEILVQHGLRITIPESCTNRPTTKGGSCLLLAHRNNPIRLCLCACAHVELGVHDVVAARGHTTTTVWMGYLFSLIARCNIAIDCDVYKWMHFPGT